MGVWAVIPRVQGTGGPDSVWSWLPVSSSPWVSAEQVQTFLVSAGWASYPVRQSLAFLKVEGPELQAGCLSLTCNVTLGRVMPLFELILCQELWG